MSWPLKSPTVSLLAVAALALAGCGQSQQAAPSSVPATTAPASAASSPTTAASPGGTYTFGVLLPLTGPAAHIGAENRKGIDLAVGEINAKGGVDGMKLVANIQDHKGTAQGGVEAMNQLANIAKVPYVVTGFSSVTLAAQPIAAQNKMLLINIGGTDTSLLNKPWLYNDMVMAPGLMPPLAKYLWDKGLRKVAMFTSNDGYGDGNRKAFRTAWEKMGGKIVGDELFPIGATDFTAPLSKIKAANSDGVLLVAVGEPQGAIVKQARSLGLQAQFFGPLGTSDAIRVGGAQAMQGYIDDVIAVDPKTTDPQARLFQDDFRKKYNTEPEWTYGTPYEAVYLLRDLIDSVVKSGGDPHSGEALLKALQAHPEFHNYLAGGTVHFTADQSTQRTLAIRTVNGGKYDVLSLIQPS